MTKKKRRRGEAPRRDADLVLCDWSDCFEEATHKVRPLGKWRDLPSRVTCKAHAHDAARAYLSDHEPSAAEITRVTRPSPKPADVPP